MKGRTSKDKSSRTQLQGQDYPSTNTWILQVSTVVKELKVKEEGLRLLSRTCNHSGVPRLGDKQMKPDPSHGVKITAKNPANHNMMLAD